MPKLKMSEEITAGLRNAIERGETLQRAMQSFINAGYNPADVKRSAEALNRGATSIVNQEMPIRPAINQEMPGRPVNSIINPQMPNKPAEISGRIEERPSAHYPAYTPLKQNLAQAEGPNYTNYANQGAGYDNYPNQTSRKNIGLVITLIILFFLLIGALIFMIVYGQKWLGSIFG